MKHYVLIILCLISANILAQQPYLRVNQDSISLLDFKKSYRQNIATEGFDAAVKTYIDFSLLLEQAHLTKVDTTVAFWGIYNESIKPKLDEYILNKNVTDEILPKIKKNFKTDRKVEIYGLNIKNPFDESSLAEKKKLILDLRNHVCKKTSPSDNVTTYLDNNTPNLRWIRPFSMNKNIEKLAYETQVGSCSNIYEDDYKMLFVKVLEERANLGTFKLEYITTGHKVQADRAYTLVLNGEDWKKVRNQYRNRKRIIKKTYNQDIPDEIYEILSQMHEGDISEPFEYEGFWHVVKLYYHDQCLENSNCDEWMIDRMQNTDYRDNYTAYIQKIANEKVDIQEDTQALNETLKAIGKDFFKTEKQVSFLVDKPIWKTKNTTYTQQHLIKEFDRTRKVLGKETDFDLYKKYVIPHIKENIALNAYVQYLEDYESEFKSVSQLLKNSIKINHFIENEIYYSATQDTVGMERFMINHATDYTWPIRYSMKIYRYNQDASGKKVVDMLKKGKTSKDILTHFKDIKTDELGLEVVVTKGDFTKDHPEIPENLDFDKTIQYGNFRNKKAVFHIMKTLPSRMMTIKEAGKALTEAYKEEFYRKTLKRLENEATISLPVTFKP